MDVIQITINIVKRTLTYNLQNKVYVFIRVLQTFYIEVISYQK